MHDAVSPAAGAAATIQLLTVLGLDGRLRWTSPLTALVLGLTHSDPSGREIAELIHPADRAAVEDATRQAATGSAVSVVHRMRHADGRWLTVHTAIERVPLGAGDAVLVGVSRVVADRDRAGGRCGEVDGDGTAHDPARPATAGAGGARGGEDGAGDGPGDAALLADLARGIAAGEIEAFYQPIVRPADGTVVKVEALARWRHPERGLVPPAEFVPAAERSGLVSRLGDVVLHQAAAQVAAWRAGPAPGLELAVNLSARDLDDGTLPDRVAAVLAATGLPAHALWLEVTETALADDPDAAVAALQRLRDLGVRIALDDFGTGFAHLAQLRRFPVQALKIDRSFVAGMVDHPGDAAIVRSVIALARELGLTCVAEGVETPAQRDALVELRCDLAQGHFFARPMPAADVTVRGTLGEAVPSSPSPPPTPDTPEAARLAALRSCAVLDTPPEPAFDWLATTVARLAGTPIAGVGFVDEARLWFKAMVGTTLRDTPRSWALDACSTRRPRAFCVPDTAADPRFAGHPLVVGDPGVRAYAGAPVVLADGHPVGLVVVMDRRPRTFGDDVVAELWSVAAEVAARLELRRADAVLHDVRSRCAALEDEVADQRRFLDAVLQATNDAVCRLTPDGTIEHLNDVAARVLGIDPQEAVGTSGFDLVHPDDVPRAMRALAGRAAALGCGVPLRLRVRTVNGPLPVEVVARTVAEHDGQRRIVLVVRAPGVAR